MAGVTPRYKGTSGPTYQVAEAVNGGQLVEARAASKVGVAAAGSLVVLGVATKDARVVTSPSGTTAYGMPVTDVSWPSDRLAVDKGWYPVTFAAAAAFGQKLIAAANGQVTPAGATPDARSIVGYCAEPAGVASGAVGLAYIY